MLGIIGLVKSGINKAEKMTRKIGAKRSSTVLKEVGTGVGLVLDIAQTDIPEAEKIKTLIHQKKGVAAAIKIAGMTNSISQKVIKTYGIGL